jgi:hypothetical protein
MSAQAPAYSSRKEKKKKSEYVLDILGINKIDLDHTVKSRMSYFLSKDFKELYGKKQDNEEITSAFYDRLLMQLNENCGVAATATGYPPLTRKYVSSMLLSKKSGETVGEYVDWIIGANYERLENLTDEAKARMEQAKEMERFARAHLEKARPRPNPKQKRRGG